MAVRVPHEAYRKVMNSAHRIDPLETGTTPGPIQQLYKRGMALTCHGTGAGGTLQAGRTDE